jgi:hypothetical protein
MVDCGTLFVEPEFDPSAFEVASCQTPPEVSPGETLTQPVTVMNNNDSAGTVPVVLASRPPGEDGNQNNTILAEQSVTVSGNSTATVDVTYTAPDQTGEWTLLSYTTSASPASSPSGAIPSTSPTTDKTGSLITTAVGLGALGVGAFVDRR